MAVEAITQSIRDAITPVFLLTGVVSVLSVMTHRLGRIIDRYRKIENSHDPSSDKNLQEMAVLFRRFRIIHWAIGTCTFCALLICVLIALMFVAHELHFPIDRIISLLFVIAMVVLITGLLLFLREIHLTTNTLTPAVRKPADKT